MDDTLAGDVELFDHSSNSQVTSTPTSATSTATSPPPVLHPPRMASSHPTPPRPPHSDDDGDDDDESKMADESFSGVPPSETTEGHSRERRMSELAAMEQRRLRLLDGEVVLDVDEQNRPIPYASNVIKTSKYTALTFLPQNLFEQLIRPANFYFVCIAILQAIPAVSISQGKPTILLPLVFVLTVSGIKDAFEDRKRHLADTQENRRKYLVWNRTKGKFTVKQSSDICVGDIVKVIDDEIYPADLLQIYSTSPGGYSYVETANLDGETNLKIKMIPKPLRHIRGEQDLDSLSFTLECDPPNGMLDQWGGTLLVSHKAGAPPPRSVSGDDPAAPGSDQATVAGLDNLLLRGSKLRNTGFIFAVAVYTGRETKIRQNSNAKKRASIKRSSVERAMNRQILGMFGMQVTICFFAGIGAATWAASHSNSSWYLDITDKPGVTGLIRFFTWFIIFAGFVPISLLVSMEMVKFWQGLFISWDENMAVAVPEEESGWQFARAQTSGLNEELGQVQFILSDKTGTLTCNSMDFRKCVVGPRQYGTGETDISKAAKERAKAAGHRSSVSVSSKADIEDDARIYDAELEGETEIAPHVSFNARRSLEKALSAHGQELDLGSSDAAPTDGVAGGLIDASSYEHQFLMNLALANTVFPTQDKNDPSKILMKASSPDEEALVEFARFMGYELCERNPPHVSVRVTNHETGESKVLKFEQLALLDFTSKRKRMSVVLRDESGRVRIYSKGADNMIGEILRDAANVGSSQEHWGTTVNRLTRFGDQGLRTLLVAGAQKEASFWDGDGDGQGGLGWRYREAMNECAVEGPEEQGHFKGSCSNECRRCAIEEEVERAFEMDLIGATAIEDKLQEYVPDSVRAFLEAGISVWVLTGDKLETAINIGMACNLLESSMEKRGNLLRIQGETVHEVRAELDRHMDRIHERDAHAFNPLGMVMTSRAFSRVVKGHMIDDFWFVATHCKSVVCCRMQPNQKAQIVRLVKDSTDSGVTTLAVGDGANDEQMIIEADVGVGIRGVEGTTAVRASDYAVSRFHFMRRLLFVHGRLNYRRISTLICYIFYKNSMICFTQLWFGIMSGFSGQPIYLEWAYQLYNVCFTAVPILVFAVFDYDIEPKTLMQYASIYRDTNRGQLFNVRIFWQWLVFSVLQSIIVFAFPYAAYDMTTADSSGQSHGVWYMGVAVYTSVVIVVNLKLALLMTSWTWLHHFSIWGSIIFYFMAMMVLNSSTAFATAGGDYYFLVFRLMGTARFWFVVILTVVTALFVDFALQAYHAIACPHVEGFAFAGWISDIAKEFAAKVHGNDGSGKKYHKPPPVPVRTERNYSAASITAPKKLRASIGIVDADSDNTAALESVRAQYPHPDAPQEQRSPQAAVRASLARRHTGFDFSATGGMGRRLGFEF